MLRRFAMWLVMDSPIRLGPLAPYVFGFAIASKPVPPYPQTLDELAEAQGVEPMRDVREKLFGTCPDAAEAVAEARRWVAGTEKDEG
jgi:hypothetical protein